MDIDVVASSRIKKYLTELDNQTKVIYAVGQKARSKGLDPEEHVDVLLAASIAERVEALISSLEPQVLHSGIAERIVELEKQYGPGDWRTALVIAKEIAKETFCKFESRIKAIEIGIRAGLAYTTQGVVAAPLEGVVDAKLKKRRDGGEYLAIYYAGPIRAAGGTAQVIPLLIADYLRKQFNIEAYDSDDNEQERYFIEVDDYVTRVTRKQYRPTKREIKFIIKNLPIELNGDPTEAIEVSNFKQLDRVETDTIRGGVCLTLTDGIPLKAKKVLKKLEEWGADFGLQDWVWLKEYIKLKDEIHSTASIGSGVKEEGENKLQPNYSFLAEMVAGRPVFTDPLAKGGFRIRYGRSRLTGDGSWAISPVTMLILKDYLATGTQLRVERAGKSTALTVCDSIEGPIVKLKDGSVQKLKTIAQAKQERSKIIEILFLGDMLISHGDFVENSARLVPPGYCPEWWAQEVTAQLEEKNLSIDVLSQQAGIEIDYLKAILNKPIETKPTLTEAMKISELTGAPLHSIHTFYWSELNSKQRETLQKFIEEGLDRTPLKNEKRALELIGCPHEVVDGKVVFDDEVLAALKINLDSFSEQSNLIIRDLSGTTQGCRMGRPEKAKMRILKGSPHVLFPVGEEGGRLRSFQSAQDTEGVVSDFPDYDCEACQQTTIYPVCETCGNKTVLVRKCPVCKRQTTEEKCHRPTRVYSRRRLKIDHYWGAAKRQLQIDQEPRLVKGVRGTSNKGHVVENLAKGILRASNKLYVNKDGTIRYDMTELGVTHFRPSEIELSVEKAKELGYTHDLDGKELTDPNQLLEIFPQDIILPACPESADEGADTVLLRIARFVDEELEKIYGLEPYYNAKTKRDLIGQIIIGLAPHTSAGIVGRIIGFSEVVCCYAHPYWHDAQRRDLDGEETCIILALDAFLNFSRQYLPDRRGTRSMDAPLVLTTILDPLAIDDEVYDLDVAWKYPLEFYRAAENHTSPWEVWIEQIKDRIGKESQYEDMGFTHSVTNMNEGVRVSAYKFIPTMLDKMQGQLDLAFKIRAVNEENVAELVIEGHFLRDIKGNLRKYTYQKFRCIKCNQSYRRMPMSGTCRACGHTRLVFTIAEGSVKKYLAPSLRLAEEGGTPPYLQQTLMLLKRRVDSIWGEERTKQIKLGGFFK